MIDIPADTRTQRGVWQTLIDLDQRQPHGWTLIGAQMVALHAYERGRTPPRRSLDADVLVNVRTVEAGTRHLSKLLLDSGFTLEGVDPEQVGHRFRRDDVSIDVLGPDGLREETKHRALATVPPARTVAVPGGTQALGRTERVPVRIDALQGAVPRPNLLGPSSSKPAPSPSMTYPPTSARTSLSSARSSTTHAHAPPSSPAPNADGSGSAPSSSTRTPMPGRSWVPTPKTPTAPSAS